MQHNSRNTHVDIQTNETKKTKQRKVTVVIDVPAPPNQMDACISRLLCDHMISIGIVRALCIIVRIYHYTYTIINVY